MKETLKVGLEHEARHQVTPDMSPPHLPGKVLSTPSMIQLLEWACHEAVAPHLDEGETTVGTHVDVSHTGPAAAGEEVVVRARLEAVVKRRLTFAVEVLSPRGEISTGSHQRAVVDLARFA